MGIIPVTNRTPHTDEWPSITSYYKIYLLCAAVVLTVKIIICGLAVFPGATWHFSSNNSNDTENKLTLKRLKCGVTSVLDDGIDDEIVRRVICNANVMGYVFPTSIIRFVIVFDIFD